MHSFSSREKFFSCCFVKFFIETECDRWEGNVSVEIVAVDSHHCWIIPISFPNEWCINARVTDERNDCQTPEKSVNSNWMSKTKIKNFLSNSKSEKLTFQSDEDDRFVTNASIHANLNTWKNLKRNEKYSPSRLFLFFNYFDSFFDSLIWKNSTCNWQRHRAIREWFVQLETRPQTI